MLEICEQLEYRHEVVRVLSIAEMPVVTLAALIVIADVASRL
ncbi:MAG: hypothetical protein RQ899_13925 [Pseudomonadales bacterium]|nr:hypothetical protein [Pseudomonadales bacterium]